LAPSSINIFSGAMTFTLLGIGCDLLSSVKNSKSSRIAASLLENIPSMLNCQAIFVVLYNFVGVKIYFFLLVIGIKAMTSSPKNSLIGF
jgi:hypothetical protein